MLQHATDTTYLYIQVQQTCCWDFCSSQRQGPLQGAGRGQGAGEGAMKKTDKH